MKKLENQNLGLLLTALFFVAVCGKNPHAPTTVEAVAGQKAVIPCNVPVPLSAVSLILWYRTDDPNPIYTLDVRNTARHFPAPVMNNRSWFDVSVHPQVLVIHPVTLLDEGYYKCRVDLKAFRTAILHSKLDVIVPPGDPILMDEYGQRLYGLVGPYDEDATLTLVCEVDGGDPLPTVTWWKEGRLLDDSFEDTDQGFVRNELILEEIGREDWMTNYTCKTSNTNITLPKEASIQLDMNLSPLEVKILIPELPMRAGEEQGIVCQTSGSRPRAHTSWWINGTKLEGTSELLADDGNVTLSALHFTPGPSDHNRPLTCKATNPALPHKAIQAEINLNVQYPPKINLSLGHALSRTKEGSNVYLECNIDSNPPVLNVTWRFNDRPLTAYRTIGFVVLNRTLLLQRIKRAHAGNYSCHATNVVGQGSSNALYIHVQFAPVCQHSEMKVYGLSLTERLDLSCDVEADPEQVQYQWSLNNSLEVPQEWMNGSVLRYSPEIGFGVLKCWASNKIGNQKEPCRFTIMPAGNPEMPQNCSVVNETSTSVSVICKAGYDGGLVQTFHLEIFDSESEHLVANLSRTELPVFQMINLSSSTSYVLLVYASNGKGRSKSVSLLTSTFSSDKDLKMSLYPAFTVFVIALILIVTSGVIVTLFRSKRRPVKGTRKRRRTWKRARSPGRRVLISFHCHWNHTYSIWTKL